MTKLPVRLVANPKLIDNALNKLVSIKILFIFIIPAILELFSRKIYIFIKKTRLDKTLQKKKVKARTSLRSTQWQLEVNKDANETLPGNVKQMNVTT